VSRPVLVWILLSLIWGSTWLCIKIGVTDMPPITLVWTRFTVALVPLGILWVLRGARWPRNRRDNLLIISSGLMTFTVNYSLIYWAELYLSSALAAILYTTLPIFGQILAHFLVRAEPFSKGKLMGSLLSGLGVILIFYQQLGPIGDKAPLAVAGVLFATMCTALSTVLVKRYARDIPSVVLTTGQILTGVLPLICLGLIIEGNPFKAAWTPAALYTVLYLGLMGTALTFGLLNWLMKHMEVTRTQLIPFASTMIAVFLGWIVLGETLDLFTALGSVSILGGLLVATR